MRGPAISPVHSRFEGKGTCITMIAALAVTSANRPLELPLSPSHWCHTYKQCVVCICEVRAVLCTSLGLLMYYHGVSRIMAGSKQI